MTTAAVYSTTMSVQQDSYVAAHIAEKVLRRAEIAKVARNLQDCLALASFKAQNGWQNRTLNAIVPEVTEHLKRKRPHSSDDILSDSSSSTSSDHTHRGSDNSTSAAQNDFSRSHKSQTSFSASYQIPQSSESRKRLRSSSSTGRTSGISISTSWKQDHHLAQSSPVFHRPESSGHDQPSFVSGSATQRSSMHDPSPIFHIDDASDDDNQDGPLHSFRQPPSSSLISSSPPRTPSPSRRMRNGATKRSGADLLLYLANSPSHSPAVNAGHLTGSTQEAPSTPPSQHTHLPSSVMNTPGANIPLFNGALQTPGQQFNFADFVNVTPSPAQAPWGSRTPGISKTPAAARAARRGLNFDALVPPSGHNPVMQRKTPTSQGLALELGDELMPRS